jgi:hypothetical protein
VCSAANLSADLKFKEISAQYKNVTPLVPADFGFLINLIGPKIAKKDATYRATVPDEKGLVVSLWFLATGDSCTGLQYLLKISKQAIARLFHKLTAFADSSHRRIWCVCCNTLDVLDPRAQT